jgi:hypothetical protein
MMRNSVTDGKSRVLLAAVLALFAQGAWSDERRADLEPAVAPEETPSAARQRIEVEIRAYIEALNKRLTEELAREIEASNASRVELAIAEVPTRG